MALILVVRASCSLHLVSKQDPRLLGEVGDLSVYLSLAHRLNQVHPLDMQINSS
jgi:hypothetical protein